MLFFCAVSSALAVIFAVLGFGGIAGDIAPLCRVLFSVTAAAAIVSGILGATGSNDG